MGTRRISVFVGIAGFMGAVALMAAPAGAQTGLTSGDGVAIENSVASGDGVAVEGSVASGTAEAVFDSTASGDATAVDGSTASGCSLATDDSTASGASIASDDSTASGGACPAAAAAAVTQTSTPATTDTTAPTTFTTVPTTSPTLARTGSDVVPLLVAGFGTLLAGWLLLGASYRRRLAGEVSLGDIFPRFDDTLATELTAAFGPGLLAPARTHTA